MFFIEIVKIKKKSQTSEVDLSKNPMSYASHQKTGLSPQKAAAKKKINLEEGQPAAATNKPQNNKDKGQKHFFYDD